jgi:hypothetical protein
MLYFAVGQSLNTPLSFGILQLMPKNWNAASRSSQLFGIIVSSSKSTTVMRTLEYLKLHALRKRGYHVDARYSGLLFLSVFFFPVSSQCAGSEVKPLT